MTTFAPSPMTMLIDGPLRYELGESTSPSLRLDEIVEPAELASTVLDYGTSAGGAELRRLVADEAGVGPEQVLVTVGAVDAMFLLAQAVCGPGDRVLLATPCFPPARTVPQGLGARIDAVALSFDHGYRLPLERVAAALTEQTRLVSLASPQNPSGVRFTDEEVRGLLAAVEERAPGAVVLVDETYRESVYGTEPRPASRARLSSRVITCSSLSKAHGAPGLRIGWLTVTDDRLYERLRQAKFHTTISCSHIDELLATRVLRRRDAVLADRADRLQRALAELMDWARDQPVEIVRPDGGALCCARLPVDVSDDAVAAFYARLAENDTRVAPGSWFGESDRVFRLGFGYLPESEFSAALDRLADALSATARY